MKNVINFSVIMYIAIVSSSSYADNEQEHLFNDGYVETPGEWNYDPNEPRLSLKGPPLFVSLGHDCLLAVCMRLENLRQAAFPFDWNYSMFVEKIPQILDEDFEFFLSRELFQEGAAFHGDSNSFSMINARYMVEFVHDTIFNDAMIEKYQRRIARFRSLQDYHGKIIFMRSVPDFRRFPFNEQYKKVYGDETRLGRITAEEAQQLRDALKQYLPRQDFLLVILNFEWADTPSISGIENVVEYRIESFHKTKRIRQILKDLDDMFRQKF